MLHGSWSPLIPSNEAVLIAVVNYRISTFLGNSLYLIAFSYYCVITFMGYNGAGSPPSPRRFQLTFRGLSTSLSAPHGDHARPRIYPRRVMGR